MKYKHINTFVLFNFFMNILFLCFDLIICRPHLKSLKQQVARSEKQHDTTKHNDTYVSTNDILFHIHFSSCSYYRNIILRLIHLCIFITRKKKIFRWIFSLSLRQDIIFLCRLILISLKTT